jgi:hypothetical protein
VKKKSRRRQRGVVLLVVLSLLTLFTLLMVTFIIVSGQYRQSALSAARVSRVDPSPTKLLDNATFALLRDSTDPKNPIRFHSLLFDMYGGDGFVGAIAANGVGNVGYFASAADGTGGNFFDLRIKVQAPNPLPPATPTTAGEPLDLAGSYHPLSFVNGYYNGCLLTVVSSSKAQGRRFRVVDYQAAPSSAFPDPSQHVFRVMPIALQNENSTTRPAAGDRVVLNGRAFNGTGFGYDSSTSGTASKLNPAYTLQPNQFLQTNAAELASFVAGDADESYDAVDFQNMALAGIIPTSLAADGVVVVPSFHRPELVNYWVANDVTMLERSIMRPMPWNHPDFDGSNPQLTLPKNATAAQTTAFLSRLAGVDPLSSSSRINPWDVDNDGDRIPDSIWVDLGFPVQTTPDGRQVRPLFAFLCTDLDGRINLNAVGSFGQIAGSLAKTATTKLARNAVSSSLPTGQGLGVAEINPTAGSDPLFTSAQHQAMMQNRYGANVRPGANGMDTFASVKLFDFPTNYFTGTTGKSYNSPPDLFGELAFGLDHRGQPTYDTPDISRTDVLSNSPYEFEVTGLQRGRADNPFTAAELERIQRFNDARAGQLAGRLASLGSEPFTDSNGNGTWDVGEPYTDSNSNGQFDSVFLNASRRRSVTTESYDVPVPPVLAPTELRGGFESTADPQRLFVLPSYKSKRALHVTDLLAARLAAQFFPSGVPITPANIDEINAEVAKMLSWDLRAGTRMDVNRPFGNGQDDNGNGVVDEHGPTSADQLEADPTVGEQIWATGTYFDHDNDGNTPGTPIGMTNPDTNAYLARYHFARHLYVLITTLKNAGEDISFDGNGPTPAIETARGLAQWAINVVDFRDADSIMTAFEFDLNPFDGWDVDGSITTDDSTFGTDGLDNDGDGSVDEADEQARAARATTQRAIVWGCERPELLITETLAFHDRRTEDLASPEGKTTKLQPSGMMREDDAEAANDDTLNDFDQRLRPRGAFFVELYNPWASSAERVPAELYQSYTNASGTTVLGVDLKKQASGTPVWRLVVVDEPTPTSPTDPDDDPTTSPPNATHVVYFTNAGAGIAGARRYTTTVSNIAPVVGGRYAVIGTSRITRDLVDPATGATNGITDYVSQIGRRTDADESIPDLKHDTTHRIVLQPHDDPDQNRVYVEENGTAVLPKPNIDPLPNNYVADIQPPVAIPIPGLNITEGSYPAQDSAMVNFDTSLAGGEGAYQTPYDTPFDTAPYLVNDGTYSYGTSAFNRIVHLQRLANPLLPFDAITNPYLTIDSMPVDLTSFNGVNNESTIHDPDNTPIVARFHSRERGDAPPAGTPQRILWARDSFIAPVKGSTPNNVATHFYTEQLFHSLGFLNGPYDPTDAAGGNEPIRFRAYGPMTTPDASLEAPTKEFVGAPNSKNTGGYSQNQPFPWLTWNNRPFVSQHEMMLVPHSRSSKLLQHYSMIDPLSLPAVYDATSGTRQYGHLLNFFATSYDGGSGSWTGGPNLYRLFDYTHVPSRFMGTETWLDPNTFASGNGTALLHPPFDRVFSFREPGKVNINTIFEARVWDAVRGSNNSLANFTFTSLVDSRRGYGSSGGNAVLLDSTVPTFFGNVFRAADAGDLVPVNSMKRAGVESSLLRSSTLTPNGATSTHTQTDGFFADATSPAPVHVEPNRNPYFRYQKMQRLSNLVTTRSNVYAIWVTMGMFEVTVENNGSGVFVERLGQEAGRETGSVKRHRAFYIVDRSIPVAFQPGENHNVEDAILLRRIIE